MKKLIKQYRSEISTIAGLLVAIGTAWSTIDFSTFNWATDKNKLIIPAMIAFGGWATKLNVKDDGTESN